MLQDAEQILVDQGNDNAKVERISTEAASSSRQSGIAYTIQRESERSEAPIAIS